MTKANESPIKATRKGNQSRKARIKASPNPMTKEATILERENQLRHRAKERVAKLTRFATLAINLDILRRIAGMLFEMCKLLLPMQVQANRSGPI